MSESERECTTTPRVPKNMWIALGTSIALISCTIAVAIRHFRAKAARRDLLGATSRLRSWQEIQSNSSSKTRIISIDFGFGKEAWAFESDQDEIDLKLRAFKVGQLILPTPPLKELVEFCHLHGIDFVEKAVKW